MKLEPSGIEACHRFGKTSCKNSTEETILRFIDIKVCKSALLNKKKLGNVENYKYRFSNSTKLFVNGNVTLMSESISFICKWLKPIGLDTPWILRG